MSLHVEPVTGSTPAQIAVELRGIIRDAYLRQIQAPKESDFQETKANLRQALDEVNASIKELEVIAQQRRPRETRAKITQMRVTCLYNLHMQIRRLRSHEMQTTDFSRAYALVQSLPTIDHSPLGREENVIRAITAILKVYWGMQLESTGKDFPDLMGELLEQVKNYATNGHPVEAVPTPVVDDEIVFEEPHDDDDYDEEADL